MFKKLLSKILPKPLKPLAGVIDSAVSREADKLTGGAASKVEAAVEAVKQS